MQQAAPVTVPIATEITANVGPERCGQDCPASGAYQSCSAALREDGSPKGGRQAEGTSP